MIDFAYELKEIRRNYGLTQQELAALLSMPRRTLEDYERSASAPPAYLQHFILIGIREELPHLIEANPEVAGSAGDILLDEMQKGIPLF